MDTSLVKSVVDIDFNNRFEKSYIDTQKYVLSLTYTAPNLERILSSDYARAAVLNYYTSIPKQLSSDTDYSQALQFQRYFSSLLRKPSSQFYDQLEKDYHSWYSLAQIQKNAANTAPKKTFKNNCQFICEELASILSLVNHPGFEKKTIDSIFSKDMSINYSFITDYLSSALRPHKAYNGFISYYAGVNINEPIKSVEAYFRTREGKNILKDFYLDADMNIDYIVTSKQTAVVSFSNAKDRNTYIVVYFVYLQNNELKRVVLSSIES